MKKRDEAHKRCATQVAPPNPSFRGAEGTEKPLFSLDLRRVAFALFLFCCHPERSAFFVPRMVLRGRGIVPGLKHWHARWKHRAPATRRAFFEARLSHQSHPVGAGRNLSRLGREPRSGHAPDSSRGQLAPIAIGAVETTSSHYSAMTYRSGILSPCAARKTGKIRRSGPPAC